MIVKRTAAKSIKAGEAVWFGCDVGKMFHRDLGVMNMDLYDYELLFDTKFSMDKKTKLEYGDSVMTHAMLITAVDLKGGQSLKWRIENSWMSQKLQIHLQSNHLYQNQGSMIYFED